VQRETQRETRLELCQGALAPQQQSRVLRHCCSCLKLAAAAQGTQGITLLDQSIIPWYDCSDPKRIWNSYTMIYHYNVTPPLSYNLVDKPR